MMKINEIIDSVRTEIVRLENPSNRSRYFIYGKISEECSASSYSVCYNNFPERVTRDIQYVSIALFKVGDVFIEGMFEPKNNCLKIIFNSKSFIDMGLGVSHFSKITDYGIEYVMDNRRLIGDLLNYLTAKQSFDNYIGSGLMDCHGPAKLTENYPIQVQCELNESQNNSILKALTQNITFIWGPPGTGKTKTIGALAARLLKNGKRVLLTALSNKALDQLILSTLEMSAPLIKNNIYTARLGNVNAMHEDLKIFSFESFKNGRNKIKKLSLSWPEHVNLCTCVAATFTAIVSSKTPDPGYVDYVIADEMSMASIPNIIAASYHAKNGIVLGGDPMQLPPIYPEGAAIPNEYFSSNIFDMAKVQRHDERTAFLDTQYRMQQPIGDLVSKIFYGGELKTGTAKNELKGEFKSNIIFVNKIGKIETVNGNIISEKEERRYNSGHSAVIAEYVIKLLKDYKPSDIGVIAPYNAQVVKIKEELKKMVVSVNISEDEVNKIQVSTIHSFQGQEKSAIIMNICDENVRPTRLTAKKELINVAISRAKELLIIVGNKDYILNPEYFSDDEIKIFKAIVDSAEVINCD